MAGRFSAAHSTPSGRPFISTSRVGLPEAATLRISSFCNPTRSMSLPAIIEAWEPGMTGGRAIAEIIYGDVNPSAKLAITIPRSVGQTRMIYNHKPSMYFHPVVVTPSTPLYPFGHGLSYNTYEYSNLRLSEKTIGTDECPFRLSYPAPTPR